MKKILGISDTWSMRYSTQCSDLYYIEDCQILGLRVWLSIAILKRYLFSNPLLWVIHTYIEFYKAIFLNSVFPIRIQNLDFDIMMNEFKENLTIFLNGMMVKVTT